MLIARIQPTMPNPLPNPFIAGETTSFLQDTEAFMAAAVVELPPAEETELVAPAMPADEPAHKTHASEFERYDLDALSRQLKTKLAARMSETEKSLTTVDPYTR